MTGTPSGDSQFHTTQWSLVAAAGQPGEQSRAALADLCAAYWYPVYVFLRRPRRRRSRPRAFSSVSAHGCQPVCQQGAGEGPSPEAGRRPAGAVHRFRRRGSPLPARAEPHPDCRTDFRAAVGPDAPRSDARPTARRARGCRQAAAVRGPEGLPDRRRGRSAVRPDGCRSGADRGSRQSRHSPPAAEIPGVATVRNRANRCHTTGYRRRTAAVAGGLAGRLVAAG